MAALLHWNSASA